MEIKLELELELELKLKLKILTLLLAVRDMVTASWGMYPGRSVHESLRSITDIGMEARRTVGVPMS